MLFVRKERERERERAELTTSIFFIPKSVDIKIQVRPRRTHPTEPSEEKCRHRGYRRSDFYSWRRIAFTPLLFLMFVWIGQALGRCHV